MFDTAVVCCTRKRELYFSILHPGPLGVCVGEQKQKRTQNYVGRPILCAPHKDSIPLCGGRFFPFILPYGFNRPSQDLMKGLYPCGEMFANRRQGGSKCFIPHPFIRKLLLATDLYNPADSYGLSIHLFCLGVRHDESIHKKGHHTHFKPLPLFCSLDSWHVDHVDLWMSMSFCCWTLDLMKWCDGRNKNELFSTKTKLPTTAKSATRI